MRNYLRFGILINHGGHKDGLYKNETIIIDSGISQEEYIKENNYLYRIRKDGVLIGWISFYLEYRKKDTAYLSVLYIKEACRSRGFGSEIIKALTRELAGHKYKTIKTHCSLRNALALHFWVRNGFDYITEIECDENVYPDNFGGLGL